MRTPERAREVRDEVAASGAEVGVVVAFGQILPESLFTAVPLGFVNVHFSLLPRWRGAAPVERAILAGDDRDRRVHHGRSPRASTPARCTHARRRASPTTRPPASCALGSWSSVPTCCSTPSPTWRTTAPEEQEGEPTYADKLTVEEFELDWSRPAPELHRIIRAGNPRPGAWTTVDGKRLKIWRARVADDGALELLEVQPEGRARMQFDDWIRGRRGEPFELGS